MELLYMLIFLAQFMRIDDIRREMAVYTLSSSSVCHIYLFDVHLVHIELVWPVIANIIFSFCSRFDIFLLESVQLY